MGETNKPAQPISFLQRRHVGKQQKYITVFAHRVTVQEQSARKMVVRHTFEMQNNTGRYSFIHTKHKKPAFRNQTPFHSLLDVRRVTLVYIGHLNLTEILMRRACLVRRVTVNLRYEYWKSALKEKWFKRLIGGHCMNYHQL